MVERRPTTPTARLSEENVRIHNAACPKDDGYFQVSLIREERARAAEHESYRQLFGDLDDFEDADLDIRDGDIALRRVASLDALKLYTGSLASLETPMNRFIAMSPTRDTHPWMAKTVMDESGIAIGDLEALDVRRLASEMVNLEALPHDSREASIGSPRPSSDTLSVSRFTDIRSARKEGRSRKRIGARRRDTVERTKVPRAIPHDRAK